MATGQQFARELDPLPLPDDTPVKVEENRQDEKMSKAQQVPYGAGWASKGGQAAYIANNILTGWMAGRHVKAEKELNKAKQEVTSAKSIYDTIAQQYSQNIESGKAKDDPEMKKLAENATAAWGNYVNIADKYSAPEEGKNKKGEKKGAGDKIKQMFGMDVDPEFFRKTSVDVLRKSGPPVLSQEQSIQSKAATAELKSIEEDRTRKQADQKQKDRWSELSKKDPKTLTPQEQSELQGLDRVVIGKSFEQQTRDELLKKVVEGKEKMTPAEVELAKQMGVIKEDQYSTMMRKNSKGEDEILTLDQKGNLIGTKNLGRGYMPPDQVQVESRIRNNQVNAFVSEYKKAYGAKYTDPVKLEADAHAAALQATSGFKGFGGIDPGQSEQVQFKLNNAIKSVRAELPKDAKAVMDNFVVPPAENDVTGMYQYKSNVASPTGESGMWWWKSPVYAGGVSVDNLQSQEREFRNRLFVTLEKQNPKMTKEQLKAMMPPEIYTDEVVGKMKGGSREMAPPPQSNTMGATPKPAYSHYAKSKDGKSRLGYNESTHQWEPVRE